MGNTIIRKCINKQDSSWYLLSVKELTSGIWESSSPLKWVHLISWEHLTPQWVDRTFFLQNQKWEIQLGILRYIIWDLENPKICLQKIPKESLDFLKFFFFPVCLHCSALKISVDTFLIPPSSRLLYDFLLIFMVPRHKEALIILPAIG